MNALDEGEWKVSAHPWVEPPSPSYVTGASPASLLLAMIGRLSPVTAPTDLPSRRAPSKGFLGSQATKIP